MERAERDRAERRERDRQAVGPAVVSFLERVAMRFGGVGRVPSFRTLVEDLLLQVLEDDRELRRRPPPLPPRFRPAVEVQAPADQRTTMPADGSDQKDTVPLRPPKGGDR